MTTRITVLYPNDPGTRFDFDYWVEKHLPLVKEKLGSALKEIEFSRVVADGMGGDLGFHAVATMRFDSAEAFQGALGPVAADVMGDIPNYTDTQPQIQVGEILS